MKLGLMAPVVTLHSQIAFPIITSSHPKKRVLPEAVSGPGPEPLGAPDQLDELRINQGPRSGVVFGTVARGGRCCYLGTPRTVCCPLPRFPCRWCRWRAR